LEDRLYKLTQENTELMRVNTERGRVAGAL